jgi:phosphate starvation-inducible PhoH-like protein
MAKRKTKQSLKTATLRFDDNHLARDLFGVEDASLRSLEEKLGIAIDVRGADVRLQGTPKGVDAGERILNELYRMLKKGYPINGADIERAMKMLARNRDADLESLFSAPVFVSAKKKMIVPRSPGQKAYIEAMRDNDIVFSIGPAGTGKSYLAVAVAVAALLKGEYDRIILARPAVEAGEKLGFLPGDMQEKVNPYLRPLRDALYDMLDAEKVEDLMAEDVIEIAPIAFMRGRTLHRAFIILDEAQNCSYQQMKMCLTRLGADSKMVITGDITQIDLPFGQRSGLLEAWRILKDHSEIAFHAFTEADIVRHPLVSDIVEAFQRDEVGHG